MFITIVFLAPFCITLHPPDPQHTTAPSPSHWGSEIICPLSDLRMTYSHLIGRSHKDDPEAGGIGVPEPSVSLHWVREGRGFQVKGHTDATCSVVCHWAVVCVCLCVCVYLCVVGDQLSSLEWMDEWMKGEHVQLFIISLFLSLPLTHTHAYTHAHTHTHTHTHDGGDPVQTVHCSSAEELKCELSLRPRSIVSP